MEARQLQCYRCLQANLNHCRQAQDLLIHNVAERFPVIALITELYKVPLDNPNWVSDQLNVTITWKGCSPSYALWKSRRGFVGVTWVTDYRSRYLENWTDQKGLILLNKRKENTCIAWRGESIVDLTWASSSACRNIEDWRVENTETLSDYKYIYMNLTPGLNNNSTTRGHTNVNGNRKWSITKLDKELMISLDGATWPDLTFNYDDPIAGVAWLKRTLENACEASMQKAKKGKPNRAAYWWNKEIAELRQKAIFF
ncbi:uncharacterized protein [Cardiocondyla obscurior]|uniref:uncharacterized protein n=1 Tax=Cardiocondyla obscurior TaxID=286306 RepID=UPI0039655B35